MWKNRQGVELKVGMKVHGYIHYLRSYGRLGDKEVTGTIVNINGKLFVNSERESEKNYPLSKFEHNYLTQPKIAFLEVCAE